MPRKKSELRPVKPKTIYIAGPITGVENYWEAFEKAEDVITNLGYIALTPSRLPKGLTKAQYMRIDFAMIDSADAVLFLPGWDNSAGALLEKDYCRYTEKPAVAIHSWEEIGYVVTRLREVLGV